MHSGAAARVEVRKGAFGDGLVVVAGGARCPVHVDFVVERAGATVLAVGDGTVATIEHLCAALVAHGVTDAVIAVDGPEVPILDGSADPFWQAFAQSGFVDGPPIDPIVVPEPIVVEAAGGTARWLPAARCEICVAVDYGVLAGRATIVVPGPAFAAIAPARTFAMGRDLDTLLAKGRGRGANLDNTVVWDETGPRNALRLTDEPVAHKLVDAIGDLALAGRPVCGRLDLYKPSHALHHAAVRALLDAVSAVGPAR